jgi:hypothetical protein
MSKAKGVGLMGLAVGAVAVGASGGLAAIPAVVGMVMVATSDRNERDRDSWHQTPDGMKQH